MEIILICATGRNREIGREGGLIWRISDDLKRFKKITMGHPVIMGRLTHESIGFPLPGRTNIVVTHQTDYKARGCSVADSIESALKIAESSLGADQAFVIGGGKIYSEFINMADKLCLTIIDEQADDADTWFPEYLNAFEPVNQTGSLEQNGVKYSFAEYIRAPASSALLS